VLIGPRCAPDGEPPLEYGVDLNAMRFVDGARENAASDGPVTASAAAAAFQRGYTLQVWATDAQAPASAGRTHESPPTLLACHGRQEASHEPLPLHFIEFACPRNPTLADDTWIRGQDVNLWLRINCSRPAHPGSPAAAVRRPALAPVRRTGGSARLPGGLQRLPDAGAIAGYVMQRLLLDSNVCWVLPTRASSCVADVKVDASRNCIGQYIARVVEVEVFGAMLMGRAVIEVGTRLRRQVSHSCPHVMARCTDTA